MGCCSTFMPLLLGANPADRRVLQAFPNMPAIAKEIADSISLCGTSAGVELLWFVRMVFPSARFQRVPNSFLVHNLHKTSIDVCLRHLPLFFGEGKTHFGNMNNLSQASSEFSIRTDLKADNRTLQGQIVLQDGGADTLPQRKVGPH